MTQLKNTTSKWEYKAKLYNNLNHDSYNIFWEYNSKSRIPVSVILSGCFFETTPLMFFFRVNFFWIGFRWTIIQITTNHCTLDINILTKPALQEGLVLKNKLASKRKSPVFYNCFLIIVNVVWPSFIVFYLFGL